MASLFGDIIVDPPQTESIKYAGSKLKLLPYILELAAKTDAVSVLDGFSGSTRVSQVLAKSGYSVVANDVAVWSQYLATCYLLNPHPPSHYRELIDHLNSVPPKNGWFTQHYGGKPNSGFAIQDDGLKKPWQVHNTQKLDAIRDEIDALSLPSIEKAVAITSLVLALDRVDNTLGHYVSYLKKWSPRSYNPLILEVPAVCCAAQQHQVVRGDVFDIAGTDVDLAYYDPPYGSNNEKMPPSRVRYASYYHVWTTVCLNDHPELFGKAKRRTDTSDTIAASVFEEFRRSPTSGRFQAVEAIERLINETSARWIILSYGSGGRATAEEMNDVLSGSSKIVDVIEVDYKRNVMARMKWTNDWIREAEEPNREFLFLLENSVVKERHNRSLLGSGGQRGF